jgi:hypothetical protein
MPVPDLITRANADVPTDVSTGLPDLTKGPPSQGSARHRSHLHLAPEKYTELQAKLGTFTHEWSSHTDKSSLQTVPGLLNFVTTQGNKFAHIIVMVHRNKDSPNWNLFYRRSVCHMTTHPNRTSTPPPDLPDTLDANVMTLPHLLPSSSRITSPSPLSLQRLEWINPHWKILSTSTASSQHAHQEYRHLDTSMG